MSRYATLTDYSLTMFETVPSDNEWLSRVPGSIFFEHGYVADYFYINDIDEKSEYPDAARETIYSLAENFYGGMRFADILVTIQEQADEQQFLKLLLGDKTRDGKREVVGAFLGRYVDDEQIEIVSMYGATAEIEASMEVIKRKMIEAGYMIDAPVACNSSGQSENWVVNLPTHMDFRS